MQEWEKRTTTTTSNKTEWNEQRKRMLKNWSEKQDKTKQDNQLTIIQDGTIYRANNNNNRSLLACYSHFISPVSLITLTRVLT